MLVTWPTHHSEETHSLKMYYAKTYGPHKNIAQYDTQTHDLNFKPIDLGLFDGK